MRRERCGNCMYWSGSTFEARCYPCNHPAEVESRKAGYSSYVRSQDNHCDGWTELKRTQSMRTDR